MSTAELIDLVMNLIIYPGMIILYAIVEQCLIHIVLTKTINNLEKALQPIQYIINLE